jgi:hypothetical protein
MLINKNNQMSIWYVLMVIYAFHAPIAITGYLALFDSVNSFGAPFGPKDFSYLKSIPKDVLATAHAKASWQVCLLPSRTQISWPWDRKATDLFSQIGQIIGITAIASKPEEVRMEWIYGDFGADRT